MQVLEATERYGLAVDEPGTFLAVFRGRCRTADVAAMRSHLNAWGSRNPNVVERRVLVVIECGSTLGVKGRAEIGAMLREQTRVKAWANVVEGDGFWASTVRGMTTTVLLMARPAVTLKTFSQVSDAALWLADAKTSERLTGLVRDLRGGLGQTDARFSTLTEQ